MRILPLSALDNVWSSDDVAGPPVKRDVRKFERSTSQIEDEQNDSSGAVSSEIYADHFRREHRFAPEHTAVLIPPEEAGTPGDDAVLHKRRLQIRSQCLGSTATDTTITSLFYYGGAGTVVYLCASVTINLNSSIFFTAANQQLTTLGNPTGTTRAILVVAGADQSCAIAGNTAGLDNVILRNVQINGNRPVLGRLADGLALIEMGGSSTGQQILNVHSYEPRGWSALHTAEGNSLDCSGMTVSGNTVGPSGNPPPASDQFPTVNEWADGISHACPSSKVTNNVVTDATDGGIVIFGAPGSTIPGNTIQATSRQLMGGINMVDWSPFSGSFEGTVVQGNSIVASNTFIKVGIAVGGMVWGSDNRTAARTFSGSVLSNTVGATGSGYVGFGIAIAGHENATVTGNQAPNGAWGGADTSFCFPQIYPLPTPQGGVRDPYTTPGTVVQDGFYDQLTILYAICRGPGPIVATGP